MPETFQASDVFASLRRDVRWLKCYALIITAAVVILGLTRANSADDQRVITAERINIVDASGTPRLVLANAERFPLPRVSGKDYPRAVQPAGLVFYDAKGNEVGGLAITDASRGKISALAFDYPNYDAIGLLTRISADGKSATAGLQINSRPPADLDIDAAAKVVHERISIRNENETAEIVLSDSAGKPRIRLSVDDEGLARIEVIDRDGKRTFETP
jgi:hypothetical protein